MTTLAQRTRRLVAVAETMLWGSAIIVLAVTVTHVTHRGAGTSAQLAGIRARTEPESLSIPRLITAGERLLQRHPLRLSRRLPSVAFAAVPAAFMPPSAPMPSTRTARPRLSLRGIVGGPPWSAILEGIPGRSTSVAVTSGDHFGDLHVRRIDASEVVITGNDTIWRLRMGVEVRP
jgi:hypothetical protein